MAQTATRRRKSTTSNGNAPAGPRRAAPPNRRGHDGVGRSPVAKAKKAAAKKAATDVVPAVGGSRLARRVATRALKKLANHLVQTGADGLRVAAVKVAEEGREVLQRAASPRLPIQCAVDIAVPVGVAWDQWMCLHEIPEGVDRVSKIERDGDELFGTIDRPGHPDWRAEILDEREEESFAWHSVEGSDCAGLITFHRLSDRLTRIELNLDVLPTSAADALALSTHLAHRRAAFDLRRLKATLELINPDLYG
jgi:uncharacterized membrane protein